MHCQGDSDNTVREEHTDVLGNCRVANQLSSCQRSNHKQGVEQDDTDDGLLIGSLLNVCTADQDGCNGIKTNVILLLDSMAAVGMYALRDAGTLSHVCRSHHQRPDPPGGLRRIGCQMRRRPQRLRTV